MIPRPRRRVPAVLAAACLAAAPTPWERAPPPPIRSSSRRARSSPASPAAPRWTRSATRRPTTPLADFYSRFPRFDWLSDFYQRFRGKPFMPAEWALWGADDPAFVRRLFAWADARRRVKLLLYDQGFERCGPFRLDRYPRARAELRRQLARPRFR